MVANSPEDAEALMQAIQASEGNYDEAATESVGALAEGIRVALMHDMVRACPHSAKHASYRMHVRTSGMSTLSRRNQSPLRSDLRAYPESTGLFANPCVQNISVGHVGLLYEDTLRIPAYKSKVKPSYTLMTSKVTGPRPTTVCIPET
jgi:hypothetical protein